MLAWHIHHEILVELLTEPIEERLRCIDTEKAKCEPSWKIERRKRLLKPVMGPLSEKIEKANQEWEKADKEGEKANQKRKKAYQKWAKADKEREKANQERMKTYQEWAKADKEWEKAYQKRKKAYQEWEKVLGEHQVEIEALHKVECPDCPWDGKTIFSEKVAPLE